MSIEYKDFYMMVQSSIERNFGSFIPFAVASMLISAPSCNVMAKEYPVMQISDCYNGSIYRDLYQDQIVSIFNIGTKSESLNSIKLSKTDFEAFMAILEKPVRPNSTFQEALKLYKSKVLVDVL